MRRSVSVDAFLVKEAMRISGLHTKRETIERALQTLIQAYRRSRAISHAGTIPLTIDRNVLRCLRHQE